MLLWTYYYVLVNEIELSTFFLFFSDVPKEQSVFIMLNGEESELCFINLANTKVR
jgi:hypothetical protein